MPQLSHSGPLISRYCLGLVRIPFGNVIDRSQQRITGSNRFTSYEHNLTICRDRLSSRGSADLPPFLERRFIASPQ